MTNLSSPDHQLKMHQNLFSAWADPAGELTTLPRPPSRLRRGIPLPFPSPLDAFGVSNPAPRSQAPSTQNPWLRQCCTLYSLPFSSYKQGTDI